MSVVKEFSFDKSKGDYVQQLNLVLKNWGYNINRQDGISFLFDNEAISVLRHYVHNDEEAAAAIIAPYVLKRGKIISGHQNHKGEGAVSITIAAPVKNNNQQGYEGIAVKFEKKGRVHALRILDQNGNQFVFYEKKKTKSSTNGEGSVKTESDLPSNFSSNNNLTQPSKKSNTSIQNNSDSGNTNELTGPKSKDDTIYDWLTDEFGAGEDGVDLVRIVREHPYAAVEIIYRNTAEMMRNGMINKYIAGLELP